jgi:hypothetical protein
MASYQRERDEFLTTMSRNGAALPLDTLRAILRASTTLQRLAVAQCNGDYPADNGQRKTAVCTECESCWAPESLSRGKCPDCRTQSRVRQLLSDTPWQPYFQGDPRGAVLQLFPAGTSHDDMYCGRIRGVYVPPSFRG